MLKKIRVLIIDDSAVVRESLSELINAEPNMEVMATASDPIFATKKLKKEIPDVITLDIEMPRMDGLTFLKKIMAQHPIPVVVISSLTKQGSKTAINALLYGAVEVLSKPKFSTKEFYRESKIRIVNAILAASKSSLKKVKKPLEIKVRQKHNADVVLSFNKNKKIYEKTEKIIVIAASTGGVQAILEILSNVKDNAVGIVIVQHMPEKFTTSFAKRLDEKSKITVKEAQNGDEVSRGNALVAPGNKHTLLKRNNKKYYVEVKDGPFVNRHRPSADVLFRSTARYAGKNAIGIILTGMGNDGTKGLIEMKEMESYNIAQNEDSCVVYGMPRAAVEAGVIDKIMNIKQIADFINSI